MAQHRTAPLTASGISDAHLVRATMQALLAPRRLVPVLVVCIPLITAQWSYTRTAWSTVLGIAMCAGFVLVAPLSWRVLLPEGESNRLVRLGLYFIIGAGVVLSIGVAIPRLLHLPRTFMTSPADLLVCLALYLAGGWGLGRDIDFEDRLERERARAQALALEVERTHLVALRAHLDPHFLFNTLNAIAEWCREDGEVAEAAILRLAGMLRTVLAGIRSGAWPLSQELELVSDLLELHRLRDPSAFEVSLKVAPEAQSVPVPPMFLLSLAENAVKHGPARGHKGTISLNVSLRGAFLEVALENPGAYAGPREGSDGLPTLQRRLELAYQGAATFRIGDVGGRTAAELKLPCEGPLEHAA